MKLSRKYFLCSLFIFLFVFNFCNTAFAAQTDIYGGVISLDTTWTKEGSPYVIYAPALIQIGESTTIDDITGEVFFEPIYAPQEPDFSVSAGTTLTIEAGTVVKFDYGQAFTISGNLIVNGTSEEKVCFTSLYDDSIGGDTDLDEGLMIPYNNDWTGIEINSGGSVKINNSVITYAEAGIYGELATILMDYVDINDSQDGIGVEESFVDIKNSNIYNIYDDAFVIDSNSVVSLISSNIRDIGDEVANIMFGSTLNIENSNIENISGDVLFVYSSSTASIKSSTINNISGDGLNISKNSYLEVENSLLTNISRWILDAYGTSTINIKNSRIENSNGGMEVFNVSTLNIADTQITNVKYNPFFEVFNQSHLNFINSSIQNITGTAFSVFQSDRNNYGTTTLNISSSTISNGNKIALEIFGKKVETVIVKSKIQNFLQDGLQVFSYPTIKIEDSEISRNDNGIMSWGANVEIKNSTISGNKLYGISNSSVDTGDPVIIAVNNWWGNASGPFNIDTNASSTANQVSENVSYTPWLISVPGTKPKCCSNVLFIPGLEASRLYKTDADGNEKRIWEPGVFHDNSELFLDQDGKSNRTDIYTRDVIDNAYLPIKGNIYSSFISSMNSLKIDGKINDWNSIPYDWRLSLDDLLSSGKEYADGKIYYAGELGSTSDPYIISELCRLASSSATGKVTIIAHSNGGLITKELANKLGDEAATLIDQIIFVAVPQAGTPAALGALLHGFQTGLPKDWLPIFISPAESRDLGKNMSSAYNLLPFSQYFNYVSSPIITFDNSALLTSWRAKYGSEINSGESLYNFLSDQSREVMPTKSDLVSLPTLNKYLLDSSQELHDTKIDSWTVPEGISLTEIAGWGEDTLSGIKYYQGIKTECTNPNIFSTCSISSKTPVLEYSPIITYEGDGTVVVPSALWTASSTSVSKYWVDLYDYNNDHQISAPLGRQHADIFEVPELRSVIENIITQNVITLPSYVSSSTFIGDNLGKRLGFTLHSPLTLDLYDENGNHTGISTTTNELEENIPGSRYITFGEVKYISVPASSTINVSMQGYSSGCFTLNVEESQGGIIVASTTFAGVPSSTSTIATINVPNGNISSTTPLIVDINGDGQLDITLLPKFDEIVVPNFSSKQTSSSRRRSVNFVATSSELFTDNYGMASTTIVSILVPARPEVFNEGGNEVKQSSPESIVVAVTTSTSVFVRNIVTWQPRSELSVLKKSAPSFFVKPINNNVSLVASVGNIPILNNIGHQVFIFIKNIINIISLWYNY